MGALPPIFQGENMSEEKVKWFEKVDFEKCSEIKRRRMPEDFRKKKQAELDKKLKAKLKESKKD